MNNPVKIILADDHKIIRDGLKALLESDGEVEVVAEAKNGQEILSCLDMTEFDVLVTDVSMPGINGLEVLEQIRLKRPDIKALVLSMHHEKIWITKALRAGAKGYLIKSSGKNELVRAIQAVSRGEMFLGEEVNQILVSQFIPGENEKIGKLYSDRPELTKREIEILGLICKQHTNKNIGEILFISTRTVDTHRRNLMEKLGVKNVAGLIMSAMRMGITHG